MLLIDKSRSKSKSYANTRVTNSTESYYYSYLCVVPYEVKGKKSSKKN